ncbi:MAG: hypothetical protein HY738_19720 [Bacteroidia bacterium]|nr:hypothetical protein [Bacteroidia bacterium]
MRTINISYGLALFAFVLVLFYGCKNQPEKVNVQDIIDIPDEKEDIKNEMKEALYPLPTPFEVTKMLNDASAPYIFFISNPPENAEKYLTEKSKALNLGIYGADISYSSTYHKKDKTMLYLSASKKLMDELEIKSPFNETYLENIEKNIENKDSLINIITESFYDTYKFLNLNNKGNLSILIIAGSWLEGLHLCAQLAITAKKNEEIIKIIAGQKDTYFKFLDILGKNKDDKDINEIYDEISKLKEIYDNVGTTLTKEQLEQIVKIIEPMRDKIIE